MDELLSKIATLVSTDKQNECHRISNTFGRFVEELVQVNTKQEEKSCIEQVINKLIESLSDENSDQEHQMMSVAMTLIYIEQCYPEALERKLIIEMWEMIAAKVSLLANCHSPNSQLIFTSFMKSTVNHVRDWDLFFSNIILKMCKSSVTPLILSSSLKLIPLLREDLKDQLKSQITHLLKHSEKSVRRNAWKAMLNVPLDAETILLLEEYIKEIRDLDVLDAAIEFIKRKRIPCYQGHFRQLLQYLIEEDLARFHPLLTTKLFSILSEHQNVQIFIRLLFESTKEVVNRGCTSILLHLSKLSEWKNTDFLLWQKKIILCLLSSENASMIYAGIEILKNSHVECMYDKEIQSILSEQLRDGDEQIQYSALSLLLAHSSDENAAKILDCGVGVARNLSDEYRLLFAMKLVRLIPKLDGKRVIDLIDTFPIDWADWDSCRTFAHQLSKVDKVGDVPKRLQYILKAENLPDIVRKCFDQEVGVNVEHYALKDPFFPFIVVDKVETDHTSSENSDADRSATDLFQDVFSIK